MRACGDAALQPAAGQGGAAVDAARTPSPQPAAEAGPEAPLPIIALNDGDTDSDTDSEQSLAFKEEMHKKKLRQSLGGGGRA